MTWRAHTKMANSALVSHVENGMYRVFTVAQIYKKIKFDGVGGGGVCHLLFPTCDLCHLLIPTCDLYLVRF
jgi:hypothetical protein